MRSARIPLALGAALCLLGAQLMTLIAAPIASAATCGTRSNYFDGLVPGAGEPKSYEGVWGYITNRAGYGLCSTDTNGGTNFATNWVMMASNDTKGWTQSGNIYRQGYAGCVKHWAEESSNGTGFTDYYLGGCASIGETDRYWEQAIYSNGSYVERSNMNTTVIHQTSWSPFGYWTPPFLPEISAEATYRENSIPGTSSTPETYVSLQVQNVTDDAWMGTCGNITLYRTNSNTAAWDLNTPSCNELDTWEK